MFFTFARWTLCILGLTLAFLPPIFAYDACTKPEVRREWKTFSDEEKADWLGAIRCLMSLPHDDSLTPSVPINESLIPPVNTSGSYYDDFVYLHMDLNIRIHHTGLFLPWHRWYVDVYNRALKQKCGYKGVAPYWNWSADARDIYHSPIFDPNVTSGLGTWGIPENDYSVADGAFADKMLAYPIPHILRRNFTLQPFINNTTPYSLDTHLYGNDTVTIEQMDYLTSNYIGDYRGFQSYFEFFRGAHAAIHGIVNADHVGQCPFNTGPPECVSGPKWAANEPIFWLHHGMVDKVWSDWQRKHGENFWAYNGGATQAVSNFELYFKYPNGAPPMLNESSYVPTDGLFPPVTIHDLMDTTGGYLCYVYE